MRSLFAMTLMLLIPMASASSNCAQMVYLDYFQNLPIDKDKCDKNRDKLRSILIDAQKAYGLCQTSKKPKTNLSISRDQATKSLYQYVDKAQVDKHCSSSVWEALGELDQKTMDPNEKDFCLKHAQIKENIIDDCRNSI